MLVRFLLAREDLVRDEGEGGELPGGDGQAPHPPPGLPSASLDWRLCQHPGNFRALLLLIYEHSRQERCKKGLFSFWPIPFFKR